MQQIKLFKGLEYDVPAMENQINRWLAESGVRVLQISANIAPQTGLGDPKAGGSISPSGYGASDVLVVVLYEQP